MLTENVVLLAENPTPAPHILCSVVMLASMWVHWIARARSMRKQHTDSQVAHPIPYNDVHGQWWALAQDLDVIGPYAVACASADE